MFGSPGMSIDTKRDIDSSSPFSAELEHRFKDSLVEDLMHLALSAYEMKVFFRPQWTCNSGKACPSFFKSKS
jgi:hypothetical protein